MTEETHGRTRPLRVVRGPLPLAIEDVTAVWLSSALATGGHQVEVSTLEVTSVIAGTATKVLVEARYTEPGDVPARLCVMGGFNEELRRFAPGNIYASEAIAFAEIHPLLDTPAPRCWFAGIDDENSHGIIVLDDVAGPGTRFGAPLQALDRDDVAAALEAQARWHARSYGWTQQQAPNLPIGSKVVRDAGQTLLSSEYWEQHYAQGWVPELPESQRDQALTKRAVEDHGSIKLALADAISIATADKA